MIVKATMRFVSRVIRVMGRGSRTVFRHAFSLGLPGCANPETALASVTSEEAFLPFYRQFLQPSELCFDVGANAGSRSDLFLTLGARVVCVEPQPTCVQHLRAKYRENSQAVVVAKGAASQPGRMSLSICEDASTLATFAEKWKTGRFSDHQWDSSVDVEVTTLDQLIHEFGLPQFCKVDVEGFEYEVLRGLSSAVPALSFEFTREFLGDAKRCLDILVGLGMSQFNYTLGEQPQFVLAEWCDGETLLGHLRTSHDQLMWGDIYARASVPPGVSR
jgi:FkbM family methyltransferase